MAKIRFALASHQDWTEFNASEVGRTGPNVHLNDLVYEFAGYQP